MPKPGAQQPGGTRSLPAGPSGSSPRPDGVQLLPPAVCQPRPGRGRARGPPRRRPRPCERRRRNRECPTRWLLGGGGHSLLSAPPPAAAPPGWPLPGRCPSRPRHLPRAPRGLRGSAPGAGAGAGAGGSWAGRSTAESRRDRVAGGDGRQRGGKRKRGNSEG